MIDVCICTHSPDKNIFDKVLDALGQQTLQPAQYKLTIIDNASTPPININDKKIQALISQAIDVRIISEPQLGIAFARKKAMEESRGDAIVFVDDDNILSSDFLEVTQKILEKHPEVGCFSGIIDLHQEVNMPNWVKPLSASLAIRDEGNSPIIDWFYGAWSPWMPACTAAMVLRKDVSRAFLSTHGSNKRFYEFGRKGHHNLMSGEDFLIALTAGQVGYKCGYFPNLKMFHYIRSNRFRITYMARLMYSMAKTDLKREVYLGNKPIPFSKGELRHRLLALNLKNKNLMARFCMWLYELTYVVGSSYRLVKSDQPFYSGKPFGS